MTFLLRGGIKTEDQRLGRVPYFDRRSYQYRLNDNLSPKGGIFRGKCWEIERRLDQGNSSASTAFAVTHGLMTAPRRVKELDDVFAFKLYEEARRFDPWSSDPSEGTSLLATLQALKRTGYVGEYRWAFTVNEAILALTRLGPLMVASDWTQSMMEPEANGLLRVDPDSGVIGGHSFLINAIVLDYSRKFRLIGGGGVIKNNVPLLRMQNSFGSSWGHDGQAYIWADDLESLLVGFETSGECAVTTISWKSPRIYA